MVEKELQHEQNERLVAHEINEKLSALDQNLDKHVADHEEKLIMTDHHYESTDVTLGHTQELLNLAENIDKQKNIEIDNQHENDDKHPAHIAMNSMYTASPETTIPSAETILSNKKAAAEHVHSLTKNLQQAPQGILQKFFASLLISE